MHIFLISTHLVDTNFLYDTTILKNENHNFYKYLICSILCLI